MTLSSQEVRSTLVQALRLDLVGPDHNHPLSNEQLPAWNRPSNFYLAGFLVPASTPHDQRADDDNDDDLCIIPEAAGLPEENAEDRKAAKKSFFPSSMGLSFLVPAGVIELTTIVRWGDYSLAESDDGTRTPVWQRDPHQEILILKLKGADQISSTQAIPKSGGLNLHILERSVDALGMEDHIPSGTKSVSIFLVNNRKPQIDPPDPAFVFQPEMEIQSDQSFVPRPDLRGTISDDWDEQVSDLHYADTPAFATGHGVSADWELTNNECRVLKTAWLPSAEVEKTSTVKIPNVELSMNVLGALNDGDEAQAALEPLIVAYSDWIQVQGQAASQLKGTRKDTANELIKSVQFALKRIELGIKALQTDTDALDAFKMANRAVSSALCKRLNITDPQWRVFQLAFILLNLPGLVNPLDKHRETVDLLFFPTGGGKTEAYLGLAAFGMVMRRLRHPGLVGAGVSVIMRYTLRLLTLDQLGRAAGLVCALELEREKNAERYGSWPFEIGLWVGKAATPNILGYKGDGRSDSARTKVRQYKNDPRGKPSPIPLENCPWCGEAFNANSFNLTPNDDNPTNLEIVCTNFQCDFTRGRSLPILAIDDPIYHRLPAFLIATVDKFASLPWVGRSGALLGGADRSDNSGFYSSAEPGLGTKLENPLPPPDLIIQDELHLISGPLGTMTGLYESAIEALCLHELNGQQIKPKIVASTATVRRAQDQIQALFGRALTQIFPPQGPNRKDSFFAITEPSSKTPARLYLGVAAQGRNPKVVLSKTWLALMGAAELAYRDAGGERNPDNPADPYMTVVGYFNSLKELGGCRRILEEQVQNTIRQYGSRKRVGQKQGSFQSRKSFSEVVELTSRVPTDKVSAAKRRLEQPFSNRSDRVDCAIATNMISVGLDITRLGLMVVQGQPKTHSEYIQATSRVGRDEKRPGLVVALLNIHKPRDRSHYERFRHYHESFYRSVEVSSVTPFSARALDRGLAGALVTFSRHSQPALTPPMGVEQINTVRAVLEKKLLDIFRTRVGHQPFSDNDERDERLRSVQNRIVDLLDSWIKIYTDYQSVGTRVQYQQYEKQGPKYLLREMLEKDFDSAHQKKFKVNRSLRDVEHEVNLYLKDFNGQDVGGAS